MQFKTIVVGSVIGCSLVLNVAQAIHNRELVRYAASAFARGHLSVGEHLPPLEASDLQGNKVTIEYSKPSTPTLLYVFRPSCIWCQRNAALANALSRQVSKRYGMIGISIEAAGLEEYMKETQSAFPVFLASPDSIERYRLQSTPETILIGRDGRVIQSWNGAYTAALHSVIESTLSIHLPELD
jgi:peroxiredoxin